MTDEQLKDFNDLVKGVYPKVALCRRLEEVMVAIQAVEWVYGRKSDQTHLEQVRLDNAYRACLRLREIYDFSKSGEAEDVA